MKIQTAERNSGRELADNVVHHRHLAAYEKAASMISGDILEIGSGEGYGIQLLAPAAKSYTGIDKHPTPAPQGLENVKLIQGTIPPLSDFEDDSFDFVVSFQVIEHIRDDKWFLREVFRVLKPGGIMILSTPNIRMSVTRNPWHVREYTPDQMREKIAAVFNQFEILGVYGNEKVMNYFEENRKSVRKFTRFDIFNFQYILPAFLLRIPYDIANRMNRNRLLRKDAGLVQQVSTSDYFFRNADDHCLDFFCIAEK